MKRFDLENATDRPELVQWTKHPEIQFNKVAGTINDTSGVFVHLIRYDFPSDGQRTHDFVRITELVLKEP